VNTGVILDARSRTVDTATAREHCRHGLCVPSFRGRMFGFRPTGDTLPEGVKFGVDESTVGRIYVHSIAMQRNHDKWSK